MKKKLSKVLAVVLSLVMVAGLATIDASTAQAAKKATKLSIVSTGKKNAKSGQKRTIKIKGTNAKKAKWSVSGTGKSYIKLAKKQGKTVSFTVKANATGKAKITAKLTKKNKVSVTYKLSCDATAIALEGKDVYLGELTNLALTATPSNAKLTADVAYGVFSDETAATASVDAVVTAGAMGCEFYTEKAGTYYVKATAGEMTSIAKVTAAERVAKLESVQQTKANELAVTFDFDASKVAPSDIVIKNGNSVVITANKVIVDKDDKKKATITTFSNMTDGKVNTISYKDGTPLEFQASNGEVASIEITPDTAPINTAVEVKALVLDANKVELASFVYGKEDTASYTFDIETGAGSPDSSTGKLTMDTIGGTATVTVTYDTGKVDASNQPITVVGKKTITAVAEGNVTGVDKVKFIRLDDNYNQETGKTYDDMVKENGGSAKDKVRVEADQAGKAYYLYAVIKDENGYEKVNGSLTDAGYTLKSSDESVMIVNGDQIKGAKKGKASVLVCDENGNVKFPISVEVEEMSKLTKLDIKSSDARVRLSTAKKEEASGGSIIGDGHDNATFSIKAYDQYGEAYSYANVSTSSKKDNDNYLTYSGSIADGTVSVPVKVNAFANATEDGDIVSGKAMDAKDRVLGKNYIGYGDKVPVELVVEVEDTENDNVKLSKSVFVDLYRPADLGKKASLDISSKTVDTALVDSDSSLKNEEKSVEIRLAVLDSKGTFVRYAAMPSAASMEYLKANKTMNRNDNVVSGNSFDLDNIDAPGKFAAETISGGNGLVRKVYFRATKNVANITGPAMAAHEAALHSGTTPVAKVVRRADNAKYTLRLTNITVNGVTGAVEYKGSPLSGDWSVENSQKDITVELNIRNNLSDSSAAVVAAKAFRITAGDTRSYTYVDGSTDGLAPYEFAVPKNGVRLNAANAYVFSKLTIYVPYRNGASDIVYDEVTKTVSGVVSPN